MGKTDSARAAIRRAIRDAQDRIEPGDFIAILDELEEFVERRRDQAERELAARHWWPPEDSDDEESARGLAD